MEAPVFVHKYDPKESTGRIGKWFRFNYGADMSINDAKLQQIETALAHQDQQIQDLSEMVNRQWKEIEFLKRQLDKAQEKLSAFESSSAQSEASTMSVAEAAALEKPPHY
jgi:SlyX protein